MEYWLSKEPVLGFHIGGFNLLIEDFSEKSELIKTNVTASIEFLREIHEISNNFTEKDKLDRYGQHFKVNNFNFLDFVNVHTKPSHKEFISKVKDMKIDGTSN